MSKVEYLKLDKQYLSGELEKSTHRTDKAERLAEESQDRVKELDRIREDLLHQLTQVARRSCVEADESSLR